MRILEHLEGFASNKIAILKALILLIKLEAKLASLCILPLILSLCLILIFLTGTWFSSMVLFGYFLAMKFSNVYIGIGLIIILHIILLIFLSIYFLSTLQKASFQKTREYFQRQHQQSKSHELEKTIN